MQAVRAQRPQSRFASATLGSPAVEEIRPCGQAARLSGERLAAAARVLAVWQVSRRVAVVFGCGL